MREKDGAPRLIEALQSHIWNHMIRKKSSCSTGTSTIPVVPKIENIQLSTETAKTVFTGVSDSSSDTMSPLIVGNNPEEKSEDGNKFRDKSDPFDNFASLIEEARRCRENAIAGNVPDLERKAQAEKTALKLAEMFFMGEDDSDGDDDEET